MIIVFIDLVGSTARMQEQGTELVSDQITKQLSNWVDWLNISDPSVMQLKNPAGDGLLLVGKDAAKILSAAIQKQAIPGFMEVRVALGAGDPQWYGEPWDKDANIYGNIVNLTARLMSLCDPGEVVVTEGVRDAVLEQPELNTLLFRCEGKLKGLGFQTYWSTGSDCTNCIKSLIAKEDKGMNDQELGMILGRIEAGVVENGRRLDRHNEDHRGLEEKVDRTERDVAVIQGKAGIVAVIVSSIIGLAGWLVFLFGTKLWKG